MAEEDTFPTHATQPLHIHQPIPRRHFSQTDSSDSPSHAFAPVTPPELAASHNRPSDFLAQLNARLLRSGYAQNINAYENGLDEPSQPPPRNKSLLNMTKGTLFGIYDEETNTTSDRSVAETPWGIGAQTPARKSGSYQNDYRSPDAGLTMKPLERNGRVQRPSLARQVSRSHRRGIWHYTVVTAKLSALFLFGVVYGVVVFHLHDSRELTPVRVEGVDSQSWLYLASWGFAGLFLGSLLPYVELAWEGSEGSEEPQKTEKDSESSLSEQLNDIVRSVGAFMGIAFAIRRLPWQSTLQLTITLALVNPALWYILDRSTPGLSVSLIVTSVVTSFIFFHSPDVLPSPSLPATSNATHLPSHTTVTPSEEMFAGVVSYENLAVVTWVGSVLFCSCVCFGSIGRRLAVWER